MVGQGFTTSRGVYGRKQGQGPTYPGPRALKLMGGVRAPRARGGLGGEGKGNGSMSSWGFGVEMRFGGLLVLQF